MMVIDNNTSLGYLEMTLRTQPALAPAPPAPPPWRWRQVLPGEERQLRALRRWLSSLLPDCPARDDLIAVATELSSNAIKHTASGQGGCFGVEVTWHGPVIRVTVADRGALNEPQVIQDPMAEHGRGLLVVNGLAARTGVCGDREGRQVWADLLWDGPMAGFAPPTPQPCPGEGYPWPGSQAGCSA
jgi:anti-sigma regulatory factor (Ser/Thr protein kinase)